MQRMLGRLGIHGLALAGLLAFGAGASVAEGNVEGAHSREWLAARSAALQVREGLQRELSVMKGIRTAQKELMQWNEERRGVGSTSRTLRPEICGVPELERWCLLLPAIFGKSEGGS